MLFLKLETKPQFLNSNLKSLDLKFGYFGVNWPSPFYFFLSVLYIFLCLYTGYYIVFFFSFFKILFLVLAIL